MTDVLMFQMPDGGEVQFQNGQSLMTDGPETAAYLSLFGGNEDDSGTSATEALEWWGNKSETDPAKKYRSQTQFLLNTLPITPANLQRFEEAAVADLAWMTAEVADDIAVQATIPSRNRVDLTIVVTINGVTSSFTLRSPEVVPLVQQPPAFRGNFDRLWQIQSFIDLNVYGFTAVQTLAPSSGAPAVTVTVPDTGPAGGHAHRISAIGMTSIGDLWLGFDDTDASPAGGQYVAKVSAAKIFAGGSVAPDFSFPLVASGVSTLGVSDFAFDSSGNMWISTIASTGSPSGLLFFPASSIASPGTPSPTVVIHQTGINNSMNRLKLDASGGLWYCNGLSSTINRLSASQLLSSNAAVVPAIVLSLAKQYIGLDFDAAGNLWAAAASQNSLDMYRAADIQASGSPAPARSISIAGASKVRFDKSGNAWVQTPQGVRGFSASDIAQSGSPSSRSLLDGAGAITAGRNFAFNPASFL